MISSENPFQVRSSKRDEREAKREGSRQRDRRKGREGREGRVADTQSEVYVNSPRRVAEGGGRECRRRLTRRSSVTFAERVTLLFIALFPFSLLFFSPVTLARFPRQQPGLSSPPPARARVLLFRKLRLVFDIDSIGALYPFDRSWPTRDKGEWSVAARLSARFLSR